MYSRFEDEVHPIQKSDEKEEKKKYKCNMQEF
jgi:hypothetical protein